MFHQSPGVYCVCNASVKQIFDAGIKAETPNPPSLQGVSALPVSLLCMDFYMDSASVHPQRTDVIDMRGKHTG